MKLKNNTKPSQFELLDSNKVDEVMSKVAIGNIRMY
jgi:hypothetical protein